MKRAFTLIELLVVIAIIAILAAILFPVFAQAKAAAKKTTAISNVKQMNLAAQMYGGDADDVAPLMLISYRDASGNVVGGDTWLDTIQPYTKSYDLVFDPVSPYKGHKDYHYFADYLFQFGALPTAGSISGGSFNNYLTRNAPWFQTYAKADQAYDGLMGYALASDDNYWGGTGGFTAGKAYASRSLTSVSSPATYAFIFNSNNFDGMHGIYGQQVGFGYCGGWVGYDYGFFGFQPRYTGGSDLCDVNTRQQAYGKGQAVFGFADGHVKAMSPGAVLQDDGAGRLKNWSPDAS